MVGVSRNGGKKFDAREYLFIFGYARHVVPDAGPKGPDRQGLTVLLGQHQYRQSWKLGFRHQQGAQPVRIRTIIVKYEKVRSGASDGLRYEMGSRLPINLAASRKDMVQPSVDATDPQVYPKNDWVCRHRSHSWCPTQLPRLSQLRSRAGSGPAPDAWPASAPPLLGIFQHFCIGESGTLATALHGPCHR